MKKLVGCCFQCTTKPSLFNIGNFDLLKFLFFGRLKPYPMEFYVVESKEQGRSPVGRVALIPTLTYLLKYMMVQWKFSYQFLINKKYLLYANLCRDEGNPTYGFYFMPISLNGALENGTQRSSLC
jgi:hypothetical protein